MLSFSILNPFFFYPRLQGKLLTQKHEITDKMQICQSAGQTQLRSRVQTARVWRGRGMESKVARCEVIYGKRGGQMRFHCLYEQNSFRTSRSSY